MLKWECLQVEGQLNMKLFGSISSMCNGKGLPQMEEVEAMLKWERLRVKGQLSMKLLGSISSMCNGKGLPQMQEVKDIVTLPHWGLDNGDFNYSQFQQLSSKFVCKGIPSVAQVKHFLAQNSAG